MGIHDIYSKRNRSYPDVYQYEKLTDKFKNQCYHIWNEFLDLNNFKTDELSADVFNFVWLNVYKIILKEEGLKYLMTDSEQRFNSYKQTIEDYFQSNQEVNQCLDVVELIFSHIELFNDTYIKKINSEIVRDKNSVIDELNVRFKENGIGYQFIKGKIIRIDNEILHKEIILPVLSLLDGSSFQKR